MRRRSARRDQENILSERTNLRMMVTAGAVAAVGIGCLYISGRADLWDHRLAGQAVVAQLGGVLIAAVALSLLWELAGKRTFSSEILAKVGVGSDVERAGVVRITDQYLREVEWDAYFRDVEKLDIVVAYARTWRSTHWDQLKSISERPNARIRVVLPDPLDTQSLAVLANRFDKTPAQLRADIVEAAGDFLKLKEASHADGVHIYFRRGDHVFSCYRLDRIAVVTFYSHSRTRRPVPTIVCESGGTLYNFIYDEIGAMLEGCREVINDSQL